MDRKILITGGSGYVGTVVVPVVAQRYPVRVYESMLFGNAIAATPNCEFIQGDIRDTRGVCEAVHGVTDIIHLAGIVTDDLVSLNVNLARQVNEMALLNLCREAAEHGVSRFIYASSSSVYGTHADGLVPITREDGMQQWVVDPNRHDCTEACEVRPMTEYAWTKLRGEEIVNGFADRMTVAIVRSATACGPAPRMRMDTIVNTFSGQAYFRRRIQVHGGDQWRSNIHVADVADLYAFLLDAPAGLIHGQVFNATCANHTALELARMVQGIIGGKIEVQAEKVDNRHYRLDGSKLKRMLGWAPKRSLEDAIRDNQAFFDMGGVRNFDDDLLWNTRRMAEVVKGEARESL